MWRMPELIDRRNPLQRIAAIDEQFRVAREGLRIARDADDERNVRCGEFLRLRFGAGARRIEDDSVEGGEFGALQRAPKQVARFCRDAFQAMRVPRGPRQGGERRAVVFDGMDLGCCSQPQRERADAGKQIGDLAEAGDLSEDQRGQSLFAFRGRLQEGAGRQHEVGATEGETIGVI